MREIENRPEFTPKYKSGKTSLATTAVLEDWEPATILCPKCGRNYTAFNKMCVLTTFPEQYQYMCRDCGHRWTDYKAQPLGSIQSWPPNLEYEDVTPLGQMGWICPKCGGVFAPHMNYCTNCTQPKMPKITCVDLGGSITGTALGTTSIVNECNTVMTNANTNSAPKIRKVVPKDDNKSNT